MNLILKGPGVFPKRLTTKKTFLRKGTFPGPTERCQPLVGTFQVSSLNTRVLRELGLPLGNFVWEPQIVTKRWTFGGPKRIPSFGEKSLFSPETPPRGFFYPPLKIVFGGGGIYPQPGGGNNKRPPSYRGGEPLPI